MDELTAVKKCEVCGNAELTSVLNLGSHPLCDDLVPVGDTRECTAFPIEILHCPVCVTAHQRFQPPKSQLFPVEYHYRPRFTSDVIEGMAELVGACESKIGSNLRDKVVLDIGCNDASLLGLFKKRGCKTIGVEPTGAYLDGMDQGHILFNSFFEERLATEILSEYGSPDVITFTNVFAHIENLPELIGALKVLISSKTLLVIENHYFGSVLDNFQFDTFYQEHLRTYSLTSFKHIAESLGITLRDIEFPNRYGGNIRVFLRDAPLKKSVGSYDVELILRSERKFGLRVSQMQSRIDIWKKTMSARIHELTKKHGRLPAKAFPGRAAILIRLLDLDVDSISAIYEKPGSMKIGHYAPGTRIPIKNETEFFTLQPHPDMILNCAWHISSEIRSYLTQNGYVGEVIDILDAKALVR